MITLEILGSPRLTDAKGNSIRSVLSQPKRLALLSYLAVTAAGTYQRRDRLLALFWPESDERRARSSLSESLSRLRKSLGPEAILTRGNDDVGLDPSFVDTDVARFQKALARGDAEEAGALYRGPLLDGFLLDNGPDFDQWMEATRSRFQRQAMESMGRHADDLLGRGDARALEWAERVFRLAPLDGDSAARVMRFLACAGHRADAIEVYERFRDRLLGELAMKPAPAVTELAERIRAGGAFGEGVQGAVPVQAPPDAVISIAAALPEDAHTSPQRRPDDRDEGGPIAPSRGRWVAAAAAVALMLVVGLGVTRALDSGSVASDPATPPDGDEVRVLILPFENQTGDRELASWSQLLSGDVGRAAVHHTTIQVIPANGWAAASTGGSERLFDAGAQAGASHILTGSYTQVGGNLIVTLDVLSVGRRELMRRLDAVHVPLDSVAVARERVGDRAAATLLALQYSEHNLRHWSVPRTPEAVQRMVEADAELMETRFSTAADLAYEIIEMEPDWPAPYLLIRAALFESGRASEWRDIVRPRAEKLVTRMTEYERAYWDNLEGEHDNVRLRAARRMFELDPGMGNNGYMLAFRGIQRNYLTLARKGFDNYDWEGERAAAWWPAWALSAGVHHLLDEYELELARVRAGRERFPHQTWLAKDEVRALAALGRFDEAEAAALALPSLPTSADSAWDAMHSAGLELRLHGGEEQGQRVLDELVRFGADRDGVTRYRRALALYDAGRPEEAVPLLELEVADMEGLGERGRLERLAVLVLSLEALGRNDEAGRYEALFPDFTPTRYSYLPRWPAALYASRGQVDRAVELLRQAFSESMRYYNDDNDDFLHNRPEFQVIADEPSYQALMRPKEWPVGDGG